MIPATPGLTLAQLLVRLTILLYGLLPYTVMRTSAIFLVIFPIWSIAEISRYVYYTSKAAGIESEMLTWIRYSLPIVLYPMGACADFYGIISFYPIVISDPLMTRYDYFLHYFFALIFPYGFYHIYGYLWSQRNKVLRACVVNNRHSNSELNQVRGG